MCKRHGAKASLQNWRKLNLDGQDMSPKWMTPASLNSDEFCVGKRNRGRPKLRYKGVQKQSLNDCNMNEKAAKNSPAWCLKVHQGAHQYESVRIQQGKEKRAKRKAAASKDVPSSLTPTPQNPLPLSSFSCPYCNQVYVAQTSLYSHLCTYQIVV